MTLLITGLLFFTLGFDHQLIRVLVASFEKFPAGSWAPVAGSLDGIVRLGAGMFTTGLRLAMPVIAMLLLIDIALALLGRMQQQLQLLSLSFPAKMLAALDSLLKRVYAHGFGVRHAVAGSVHGLLQDQVQVAAASIAAYNATGKLRYLEVAKNLAAVLERDFADPQGGYFDAAVPDASAPALTDRTKQVLDDLLPGANAAAARVLLRLAAVTGEPGYRRRARATLEAFAGGVDGAGLRAATFLAAAREALLTH